MQWVVYTLPLQHTTSKYFNSRDVIYIPLLTGFGANSTFTGLHSSSSCPGLTDRHSDMSICVASVQTPCDTKSVVRRRQLFSIARETTNHINGVFSSERTNLTNLLRRFRWSHASNHAYAEPPNVHSDRDI